MTDLIDLVRGRHSADGIANMITTGAYRGLAAIVSAEFGLPVGFCLAGDSPLVTAGVFCSPHAVVVGVSLLPPVIGAFKQSLTTRQRELSAKGQ